MKAYIILILLCVPIVLWGQKNSINNREKLSLKGSVKSIDEKIYALKVSTKLDSNNNKIIEYDLTPNEIEYSFNSKGWLISEIKKHDNDIYSSQLYKYNPSGELIEEIYTEKEIEKRISKGYNTEKKEKFINTYVNTELHQREVIKHDESGRILKKTEYNGNGKLVQKWIYKYSWNGKLESVILYKDNQFVSESNFIYNSSDQLISKIETNYEDGKIAEKTTTSFDLAGNIRNEHTEFYENDYVSAKRKSIYTNGLKVKETDYDMFNKVRKEWIMSYNYLGKLESLSVKKVNFNKKMVLVQSVIKRYDEKGNLTENKEVNYSIDGDLKNSHLKTYFYKYDDKGNWVVKYDKENEHPVNLIVRDIKYFDKIEQELISVQQALNDCITNNNGKN